MKNKRYIKKWFGGKRNKKCYSNLLLSEHTTKVLSMPIKNAMFSNNLYTKKRHSNLIFYKTRIKRKLYRYGKTLANASVLTIFLLSIRLYSFSEEYLYIFSPSAQSFSRQ